MSESWTPAPVDAAGLPLVMRTLRSSDASGVLTLERALAEDGAGMVTDPRDLPDDEAAMRRRLRPFLLGELRPPHGLYLLLAAEKGGTVPILASGEIRRLAPARVRHVGVIALGVHPSVRRRGLGRALVEALTDWAFGQGVSRIELSVRDDNAPARALYERCGFVVEGRRARFVRLDDGRYVDDLIMARLAPAPPQLNRE